MKEKEEGATPRRPGLLVRLTALAVTAALLLGALALVVPDDAYSRLDIICGAIKESLNSFRWAMGEEET